MQDLLSIIKEHIENNEQDSISFYEYMGLALYHPEQGYYSRPKQKIGKEGDFYTSVSVGTVFGEVLGKVLMDMLDSLEGTDQLCIVEFGGGTGDLTWQILQEWERSRPDLMQKVQPIMVEKSPFHRKLQQEKLNAYPVQWFDSWQEVLRSYGPIHGVVFSNELLDAFPVYLLEYEGEQWKEVRVAWDEEASALKECLMDLKQPKVLEYLRREEVFIPKLKGFRLEVNADADQWIEGIAMGMEQGFVVTIDYGYLREELFAPHRRAGTMMCYYRHTASDTPLLHPGEQDITTHVNYGALIEEGEKHGLRNIGFFTQAQFLMNGGILQKLQSHQETDPFHGEAGKRNRAIRQLIMPGGMGETFKVLVQAKGDVRKTPESLKPKGWV